MNHIRKTIIGVSALGAAIGGTAIGLASIGSANAATGSGSQTTVAAGSSSTDSTTAPSPTPPTNQAGAPAPGHGAPDPSKGGHTANGITEAVLTGDTATKAEAAAKAAVPGATIDRVENDAEGATYEAHMTKADGSKVTVKLNADFSVKSIDNGMG